MISEFLCFLSVFDFFGFDISNITNIFHFHSATNQIGIIFKVVKVEVDMSSQSSLSWYSASDNASVNNDSNCNRSNNNNNLCSEQILLNRTGSDEIATENDKHQIDCGAEDNKHKANQTTSELRPKQISFYQKCGKIIRRAKNKSTFQFPWIIVLISTLQVNSSSVFDTYPIRICGLKNIIM